MAQSIHSEHVAKDSDGRTTLSQAAQSLVQSEVQRPNSQAVVEALVKTEQDIKTARTSLPIEALLGSWRLCFTANKKSRLRSGTIEGRGRYIPGLIKAHLIFSQPGEKSESDPSQGQTEAPQAEKESPFTPLAIANQLQLGVFTVRLTGPAKYLERKNLLAFDFTQMHIRLFGLTLYHGGFPGRRSSHESFAEQAIAKLPFFAFIAATDSFIAARGRGGGLALWVCDQQGSEVVSEVPSRGQ